MLLLLEGSFEIYDSFKIPYLIFGDLSKIFGDPNNIFREGLNQLKLKCFKIQIGKVNISFVELLPQVGNKENNLGRLVASYIRYITVGYIRNQDHFLF